MAERLSWVIELIDQMSGPAGRMTKALTGIEGALRKQAAVTADVNKRYKLLGEEINRFTGFAGGALLFFIGTLGAASAAFTYFGLKASVFGENTQLSLEAILGSKAVASVAQNAFQKLTTETSLGLERITKYGAAYLQLGDTLDSAIVKIKILGSLQVAKGGGEEGAAAADRLQGVMLRFMTGDLPPSRNQLKMMLAEAGTTVEELENQVVIYSKGRVKLEQVKADLLKNQIPSDVLVTPLAAAIQKGIDGSTKVGATAFNAANNSLGGLMQRMKDNLFIDFDFSRTPGFNALKSVLRNLVTLTQPGGSFQKNMQDFAVAFSQFLDPLKGPEGLKRMETFFTSLTSLARSALPIISFLAEKFAMMVDAGVILAGTIAINRGGQPNDPAAMRSALNRFFGPPPWEQPTPGPQTGTAPMARVTLPTVDLSRRQQAPLTLPPITLHLNIHTAATNKDEAKKISDAVQDTLPTALQRAFENLATQGGY